MSTSVHGVRGPAGKRPARGRVRGMVHPMLPSEPSPSPTTTPGTRVPLRERLQNLVAEYGAWALAVWFVLFGLTFAGFAVALTMGLNVEGAAGTGGVLGGAYVATQLTKPVRIFATMGLTPVVARFGRRLTRKR